MAKILGEIELDILADVAFFRYYTASQLCRHRYASGSLNWARKKLADLFESQHLRRQSMPRPTHNPSLKTEWIYTLSPKGARVLRGLGVDASCKEDAEWERNYYFLLHTLGVNDFLICARRLERNWNNISIPRMEHELWLKANPGYVEIEGQNRAISPDAYALIRANDVSHPILLELDRGTESHTTWADKLGRLVPYIEGPYKQRYKVDSCTVAVVAHLQDPVKAQARRRELLRWIEQTLTKMGKANRGDLFQVSCQLPAQTPERDYFFTTHWRVPFRGEEDFALLEV